MSGKAPWPGGQGGEHWAVQCNNRQKLLWKSKLLLYPKNDFLILGNTLWPVLKEKAREGWAESTVLPFPKGPSEGEWRGPLSLWTDGEKSYTKKISICHHPNFYDFFLRAKAPFTGSQGYKNGGGAYCGQIALFEHLIPLSYCTSFTFILWPLPIQYWLSKSWWKYFKWSQLLKQMSQQGVSGVFSRVHATL